MKLSKHAKFWALGALGGVGLFALGVFAQQNGALDIDSTNQDLFSDLKAVFFLDRNGDEIDSIVRLNVSNGTVVSAPTSDLAGGEAENTLQNNASIIGSTNSVNTSSGAFLIATNSGRVEGESMQSFVWGASNTTLKGYNAIAVATKNTNLKADNTLALAAKDSTVSASDSVVLGGESITINPGSQASLAVWSKINVLGASGALVFNGKTIPLQVDTASAHTMVVNADNGLIINTNNSNNQKIQLTVSGAIKLGAVANAPTQTSPYISTKRVGNVSCICAKTNNEISALSKYSRNNKQYTEICQKVCNNETPTLLGQCGAAATNYPLTQTQWSTDDFCQWGLGYAGAKPTFPTLGGQVSWTCESFPSGGPTCTATRKGCGDGIRAAGEQCDLGTNNGKPDSSCSISCETVKDPKCGANAKTYSGSDVAWAQPNGFCTDDSVLGETTPAFWNGSTSWQKTWTCKNKNNKNLTCSANRLPPAVAGVCGTTLNTCSAGTLSGETSIAHGKRRSCDGLYGGSNKTCSTCDSGYKYNTTTNICEVDCPNPIYRHTNGVTIKAAACAESGKEYMFEGQKYYVARDKDDIKEKIATNAYPANRIVTTRVTDMGQMFHQNSSFNQDIGNWDTSNVTTMYGMFRWAQAFNQPLNNWDTSKVTTMSFMFTNAQAFDQPLNNWDTSKVTTMSHMFDWAGAFNQPLNNWDTSKVTDMMYMFEMAQAFNQPLNNWDTSKVTTMQAMFYWVGSFDQPLNNWDTSKVTDMSYMFYLARAFNQPLNNWDTSKVTTMNWMFTSATAFNQPLNNWDTSKVTDMSYMFYLARAFNQPLNNRRINQIWDGNLKDMFTNATAFKANQPYCIWANWSAKKWNFTHMGLNTCDACYSPDPTTFPTQGTIDTSIHPQAETLEEMKTVMKRPSRDFILDYSRKYLYIRANYTEKSPGSVPGWKFSPTVSSRGKIKLNISMSGYKANAKPWIESGEYEFRTRQTYYDATWYIRITLNKTIPECQIGYPCIIKINNVEATLPQIKTKCDSPSSTPTCPSGFTASNGKCVKRECKKEEKCNCFVSQGRVQVACEGLPAGLEGFCYRELPPKPTITEDTKQQCESKPKCQWREVNRSICVDNNSNRLSDVACSSIGPKLDCNRPQTPPPPPGPPAQLKINGQCKTYGWSHTSQPATNTTNGCLAGDYEDVPDDAHNWKWKCKGKNGGTEDICSAGKLTCNSDEEASTIEQVWNTNQCRILSTPKCVKKSITVNFTGSGCWDCPFGNYREVFYRWFRYYCKDLDAKVMCWRRPRGGGHWGHYSSTPPKMTDLEWSHTQQYDIGTFKNQCKKI